MEGALKIRPQTRGVSKSSHEWKGIPKFSALRTITEQNKSGIVALYVNFQKASWNCFYLWLKGAWKSVHVTPRCEWKGVSISKNCEWKGVGGLRVWPHTLILPPPLYSLCYGLCGCWHPATLGCQTGLFSWHLAKIETETLMTPILDGKIISV